VDKQIRANLRRKGKFMKILHVASFLGNIGDNASHMGFGNILDTFFNNYEITRLEIRKFYQNYCHKDKCAFDEKFIELVNTFDCLIIGGGGFLDYWVKDSITGTTLDMDPLLLKKIKVPMLITSIGCNPNKDVPEGNIEKFTRFLDEILSHSNIKIALRNDGSVNSIRNEIGEKYLEHFEEILDNGFFYQPQNVAALPIQQEYVAINVTNDQIAMHSTQRALIDPSRYFEQLADVVTHIANEKRLKIVFIPHIYSDLKAISELLLKVDDYIIREHITIAPCIQNDEGANLLFSIYQNSRLVVGMRYHANVCNMAMGKQLIGMAAMERVKYVHDYFGFSDRYVSVDGEFAENLMDKLSSALNETDASLNQKSECIRKSKEHTIHTYEKMFIDLGLIKK